MEAWLAILICFAPPSALAALPPRTPKWRRARKWFWVVFPLGVSVFAFNVYFIDPAGPAVVLYGAWFVFVLVATGWCWAIAIIRTERSEWREERDKAKRTAPAEPEQQRDTAAKPWKK